MNGWVNVGKKINFEIGKKKVRIWNWENDVDKNRATCSYSADYTY